MTNLEKRLNDAIEEGFDDLANSPDSQEYSTKVDDLVKLVDRAIEIEKIQTDADVKKEQATVERKDQKWKNGISIAGIVVPSVLTIWGTLKSFKFEQTGTVTTILGRGFINKLLPKK